MAEMQLLSKIVNNGTECAIELHMDGKPLGHIFLVAADLEGFIRDLAQKRALLSDEVPRELDPGSRVEATIDPIWRGRTNPETKDRELALRHPGLGWLGFGFPKEEALSVARWLAMDNPPQ